VHILRGYTAQRALGDAELGALADFMWAGALACGFYRWRETIDRSIDR
jgi:Ser/Thr protein kinase RdoA (MazF antagonist)